MSSQQNTQKYSHWNRLILSHANESHKNLWLMIYSNLYSLREGNLNANNKYLFIDILDLFEKECILWKM